MRLGSYTQQLRPVFGRGGSVPRHGSSLNRAQGPPFQAGPGSEPRHFWVGVLLLPATRSRFQPLTEAIRRVLSSLSVSSAFGSAPPRYRRNSARSDTERLLLARSPLGFQPHASALGSHGERLLRSCVHVEDGIPCTRLQIKSLNVFQTSWVSGSAALKPF